MIIKGDNEITLNDILIGDVWFCSGQSNMVLPMERLKEKYPYEAENDSFSEIRNFFVPTSADINHVHDDLPPAKWVPPQALKPSSNGRVNIFFCQTALPKISYTDRNY